MRNHISATMKTKIGTDQKYLLLLLSVCHGMEFRYAVDVIQDQMNR